jgi:ABC-type bacteriocin/lantibiotic exporter with double-glycine peptidase domain
MTTLLTRILSELKIPYTKNFSEDLYKENPYCYTLYGLQHMLSRYNVKTTAVKLPNKSEMANLDRPFLAEAYNDIVIVKRIAKDGRIIYDWYGQEMSSDAKDF